MISQTDDELLDQLVRGNGEALGELFAVYESYLRAVVRGQLSDQLRAKFDSIDVVQSVWVQLLRRLGQDGYRVNDRDHLRALLVTIARRRLLSRARRFRGRHEGETALDETGWEAITDERQSTPSETAQANDLWAQMLDAIDPDHRQVLTLKREGLPLQEIAARTGLHEGSVRRILRRLSRELALRGAPAISDGTSPDGWPE